MALRRVRVRVRVRVTINISMYRRRFWRFAGPLRATPSMETAHGPPSAPLDAAARYTGRRVGDG